MRRVRGRWQSETTLAQAWADLRAEYNAAGTTRFRKRLRGVSASGSGADYHYKSEADFLRMMELARHFDRNDMVVGQGVTRLVSNVLQDGIHPDPQTGSEEADQIIADKYRAWAEDANQCDKSREYTHHQQALLTLRALIVDGDICHLPLLDGSLQAMEAHRLRTPSNTKKPVVHGILMDEFRVRQEYWFTKEDIDPNRAVRYVRDVEPIDAYGEDGFKQVFHIRLPRRFSQTRGVTAFAPIVDSIGMHDDILFAKLVQSQITSCFAIFHNKSDMASPGFASDGQHGEQTTETLPDGGTRLIEGIAPGMEIFGEPGEKLEGFSPNVPNPEFFTHAMLMLGIIAVNLDLPLAVFLLDPTKTNFSGWRGAMDQAKVGFRRLQWCMINYFYQPAYMWKVRQFAAEDAELRKLGEQSGVNLLAHKWRRPRWPYIEPMKDIASDALRIATVQASPRQVLAERGLEWDVTVRETITDNTLAISLAKEGAAKMNKQFPDDPVHWRELLTLPLPKGMTLSIGQEPEQETASNVAND